MLFTSAVLTIRLGLILIALYFCCPHNQAFWVYISRENCRSDQPTQETDRHCKSQNRVMTCSELCLNLRGWMGNGIVCKASGQLPDSTCNMVFQSLKVTFRSFEKKLDNCRNTTLCRFFYASTRCVFSYSRK